MHDLLDFSPNEMKSFPTLRDLILECWDSNPALWGLRKHKKEKVTSFGPSIGDWEVIEPLTSFQRDAMKEYGGVDPAHLVVCHAIDYTEGDIYFKVVYLDDPVRPPPSARRDFVRVAMH